MEEFSKRGLKLRPRKTSAAPSAGKEDKREYHHRSTDFRGSNDRRPYEHRSGDARTGERRFGEHKSGENRTGERRFGERRFEGNRNGENRTGERRFGERRFGERRFDDHKSDENRSGEHRFGERRFDENRFQGHRGFPARKPFDRSKPFDRRDREPQFSRESEEGIDRMISRKSRSDADFASRKPKFQEEIPEEIRLNRFIANSGVCSRREADTFIQAGVVTVNGEVVTELGTKVNVLKDEVRFNGQRLKGEEKVYIVMNKPKGYVTTASDPHADHTVMELLSNCESRVFPVGRLDKNTTGVLMFTNDGEISERLTHPSFEKKKIYQVILDRALDREDYDSILSGITLNDGEIKADELEFIDETDHRKLGIEIHSGKNRIVRRIFESLGYDVRALDRVYFAGLTKKGLKRGEWRYLSEGEVNILKMGAYV